MKSFKIFGAVSAAALAAGMLIAPVSAHSPEKKGPVTSILPSLVGPIGVAAAVGTTATSVTWTTIATKTWTFPWQHVHIHRFVPIPNPTLPNSWAVQGIHATGQYVSNVINPHYFNESLYISNPLPGANGQTGQHTTSAQYKEHHQRSGKSRSQQGKMVVACVMGSALGAITASIRKASAMGNPPRWRSQAEHEKIVASGYEKQFELTNDEAKTSTALCGLGSFALHWPRQAVPVVVKAKY
jgi:hypothetical protein